MKVNYEFILINIYRQLTIEAAPNPSVPLTGHLPQRFFHTFS